MGVSSESFDIDIDLKQCLYRFKPQLTFLSAMRRLVHRLRKGFFHDRLTCKYPPRGSQEYSTLRHMYDLGLRGVLLPNVIESGSGRRHEHQQYSRTDEDTFDGIYKLERYHTVNSLATPFGAMDPSPDSKDFINPPSIRDAMVNSSANGADYDTLQYTNMGALKWLYDYDFSLFVLYLDLTITKYWVEQLLPAISLEWSNILSMPHEFSLQCEKSPSAIDSQIYIKSITSSVSLYGTPNLEDRWLSALRINPVDTSLDNNRGSRIKRTLQPTYRAERTESKRTRPTYTYPNNTNDSSALITINDGLNKQKIVRHRFPVGLVDDKTVITSQFNNILLKPVLSTIQKTDELRFLYTQENMTDFKTTIRQQFDDMNAQVYRPQYSNFEASNYSYESLQLSIIDVEQLCNNIPSQDKLKLIIQPELGMRLNNEPECAAVVCGIERYETNTYEQPTYMYRNNIITDDYGSKDKYNKLPGLDSFMYTCLYPRFNNHANYNTVSSDPLMVYTNPLININAHSYSSATTFSPLVPRKNGGENTNEEIPPINTSYHFFHCIDYIDEKMMEYVTNFSYYHNGLPSSIMIHNRMMDSLGAGLSQVYTTNTLITPFTFSTTYDRQALNTAYNDMITDIKKSMMPVVQRYTMSRYESGICLMPQIGHKAEVLFTVELDSQHITRSFQDKVNLIELLCSLPQKVKINIQLELEV